MIMAYSFPFKWTPVELDHHPSSKLIHIHDHEFFPVSSSSVFPYVFFFATIYHIL
jgi:hypothetical protein